MTPQQIRGVVSPHLYRNPFWSDPVDAAADPMLRAAAEEILEWEPVRSQRVRTALWIYVGLWVLDVVMLGMSFTRATDEESEAWGWPAGILFLALLLVVPGVLAVWCNPASKRVAGAKAAISHGSAQRYQEWLGWLAHNDPVAHGQVVLWHQGNQANQLATAQLVAQLYTAYQVSQSRKDIRNLR